MYYHGIQLHESKLSDYVERDLIVDDIQSL
jgi:hypothetical protein